MSTERSGKSHAVAWTLMIIAAPVLYVLTYPFLYLSAPQNLGSDEGAFPKWLIVYSVPWNWCEGTPAEGPLRDYEWWVREHFYKILR